MALRYTPTPFCICGSFHSSPALLQFNYASAVQLRFCSWLLQLASAVGFYSWLLQLAFAVVFCSWLMQLAFAVDFCSWLLQLTFAVGFNLQLAVDFCSCSITMITIPYNLQHYKDIEILYLEMLIASLYNRLP